MKAKQIYLGNYKTGKTRKLIEIYLDLVINKSVTPEKILFFCTNENSLQNIILEELLKSGIKGFQEIWITNYFAFCKKILLESLDKKFEVISGFEQKFVLKKVLDDTKNSGFDFEQNIEKLKYSNTFLKDCLNFIDSVKLNYFEFPVIKSENLQNSDFFKILKIYQSKLEELNFLDYRDLAIKTIEFLRENPSILKFYLDKFEYIFIDDLEEITSLDFELLKLFCNAQNAKVKIFAALNENASIFGFRGANPKKYVSKFIEEFKFERNFLETPENKNVQFEYKNFVSERDEISWIAQKIRDLIVCENYEPREIGIIRRNLKNSSKLYREIFDEQKIPFYIKGTGGIFTNPQIINLILYLKILNEIFENNDGSKQFFNFDLAYENFVKILTFESKNKAKIHKFFYDFKKKFTHFTRLANLVETFKNLSENKNNDEISIVLIKFFEIADFYKTQKSDEKFDLKNLIYAIAKKYDLLNFENPNIEELSLFLKVIGDFKKIFLRLYSKNLNLKNFVEYYDEILEAYTFETALKNSEQNVVKISTIQDLKGEFEIRKIIFFAGCSENIIPEIFSQPKFFDSQTLQKIGIELEADYEKFYSDEKNLFDFAISRADEKCFVSHADNTSDARSLSPSALLRNLDFGRDIFADSKHEIVDELLNFSKKNLEANNFKKSSLDKKYLKELLKNFVFSKSSLEIYKKCKFKFFLSYLLRIKIQENQFNFGLIVHEILHKFHTIYRDFSSLNNQSRNTNLNKIIDETLKKNQNMFDCEGEKVWLKNKIENLLQDYLDDVANYEPWKIIELEKTYEKTINGVNFKGKIDRIDKVLDEYFELLDYKTGEHKFTGKSKGKLTLLEKIETVEELQFLIYYLLLQDEFDEKLEKFSYIWLEKKTGNSKKFSINIKDLETLESFKIAEKNLFSWIQKIQNDELWEIENFNECRSCNFGFICRGSQDTF